MLRVGLTGGIGTGKTTVLSIFSRLSAPTASADEIARQLLTPGSSVLQEVQRQFPAHIFQNGQLDRGALRKLIFDSPSERKRLENILHPLVYQSLTDWLARQTAPYCVLEIPLLIETGQQTFVDRILVVDCPEKSQRARLSARDRADRQMIDRVLQAQANRNERLKHAHDVITNDDDEAWLTKQVHDLDRLYRSLDPLSTSRKERPST